MCSVYILVRRVSGVWQLSPKQQSTTHSSFRVAPDLGESVCDTLDPPQLQPIPPNTHTHSRAFVRPIFQCPTKSSAAPAAHTHTHTITNHTIPTSCFYSNFSIDLTRIRKTDGRFFLERRSTLAQLSTSTSHIHMLFMLLVDAGRDAMQHGVVKSGDVFYLHVL